MTADMGTIDRVDEHAQEITKLQARVHELETVLIETLKALHWAKDTQQDRNTINILIEDIRISQARNLPS